MFVLQIVIPDQILLWLEAIPGIVSEKNILGILVNCNEFW